MFGVYPNLDPFNKPEMTSTEAVAFLGIFILGAAIILAAGRVIAAIIRGITENLKK